MEDLVFLRCGDGICVVLTKECAQQSAVLKEALQIEHSVHQSFVDVELFNSDTVTKTFQLRHALTNLVAFPNKSLSMSKTIFACYAFFEFDADAHVMKNDEYLVILDENGKATLPGWNKQNSEFPDQYIRCITTIPDSKWIFSNYAYKEILPEPVMRLNVPSVIVSNVTLRIEENLNVIVLGVSSEHNTRYNYVEAGKAFSVGRDNVMVIFLEGVDFDELRVFTRLA